MNRVVPSGNTEAEVAIYYLKISVKVQTYCEICAENEGTVAELEIPSRTLSIVEWTILILPCIKISAVNYRGNRKIVS